MSDSAVSSGLSRRKFMTGTVSAAAALPLATSATAEAKPPPAKTPDPRDLGKNSFARKPSAVIGTSPGTIGTAVAQQSLRSVLSFCNSPQMNAPEAYIQFTPGLITESGEVTVESTREFLRNYMVEFHMFIARVLQVLPKDA